MTSNRIYQIIKDKALEWLPELRNPESEANLYGLSEFDMIYDIVQTVLKEEHDESNKLPRSDFDRVTEIRQ